MTHEIHKNWHTPVSRDWFDTVSLSSYNTRMAQTVCSFYLDLASFELHLLMTLFCLQAIRVLIERSRDLQREIVAQGRVSQICTCKVDNMTPF